MNKKLSIASVILGIMVLIIALKYFQYFPTPTSGMVELTRVPVTEYVLVTISTSTIEFHAPFYQNFSDVLDAAYNLILSSNTTVDMNNEDFIMSNPPVPTSTPNERQLTNIYQE